MTTYARDAEGNEIGLPSPAPEGTTVHLNVAGAVTVFLPDAEDGFTVKLEAKGPVDVVAASLLPVHLVKGQVAHFRAHRAQTRPRRWHMIGGQWLLEEIVPPTRWERLPPY